MAAGEVVCLLRGPGRTIGNAAPCFLQGIIFDKPESESGEMGSQTYRYQALDVLRLGSNLFMNDDGRASSRTTVFRDTTCLP